MKKLMIGGFIAGLLGLLLFYWGGAGSEKGVDQAQRSDLAAPSKPASTLPSSPVSVPSVTGAMVASTPAATTRPGSPRPVVRPDPASLAAIMAPAGTWEATVWQRLGRPEVLEENSVLQANGMILRKQLVRSAAAKYPLLIVEGSLPADQPQASGDALQNAVAKVASHAIARPKAGLSEAEFAQAVKSAGYELGNRLGPDGPYLVKIPDPKLSSLDEALNALEKSGSAAYAEPDYILFAADLPGATLPVEVVDGITRYPEAALDDRTLPPPAAPVLDPAHLAKATQERLSALPAGARILTFDLPTYIGGQGTCYPYLEEQNFQITTSSGGVVVQGGSDSILPKNGGCYVAFMGSEGSLTIRHREGVPFRLLSIDISEYSVLSGGKRTITFVGYKADGSTVTQAFVTDGIIDGTGPVADFETFTFDDRFKGLTKVVADPPPYMVDNITVLVDGSETQVDAPVSPLIYDVTWSPPKHVVNQLTSVGGSDAPSSINFGTPTVRDRIGSMQGPALEFVGPEYQQIRFGVGRKAKAYRLEFDAYFDPVDQFSIYFDGAGGVQRLDFNADGHIYLYQNGDVPGSLGIFPARKVTRIAVDIDMKNSKWEIFVDGISQYIGVFVTSSGDLTDIRFHQSFSARSCGIDNLKIYAYPDDAPLAPKLTVSSLMQYFLNVVIGTQKTWKIKVINGGTAPLTIYSVSSSSSQFRVSAALPVDLLPEEWIEVETTFVPEVSGASSGTLSFTSNDPTSSSLLVSLYGTAFRPAEASLLPYDMDITMLQYRLFTKNFQLGASGDFDLGWNFSMKAVVDASNPPKPVTPLDPDFEQMWGMMNSTGGIDAVRAWAIATDGSREIVAIIDSGVDYEHPDLQGNLFVNSKEIPGNGIDDDRNGYVDDVNGWDFVSNDADPMDGYGHGTHVAGTVAAAGNNNLGVVGVCWKARIMPLKFLDDAGKGASSDAVSAIYYATKMGARISNNSWGGGDYSQSLYDAIKAAGETGAVFVAAAGNDDLSNNDLYPKYPASYSLDNIISVAAVQFDDSLAEFSNFGPSAVDLAAPGVWVLSLQPGGKYEYKSGTSMAAPHVTGSVALLRGRDPSLSPAKIRMLLSGSVDPIASLMGLTVSDGRLNVFRALRASLPGWLDPQLTSGSLATGASLTLPVVLNTNGLFAGNYSQILRLSTSDPKRSHIDIPIQLGVLSSTAYHHWLFEMFGPSWMLANSEKNSMWGNAADPDGDGVSNIMEYLIGGDARKPDAAGAPRMVELGADAVFEFTLRTLPQGVSYWIQWNPGLDSKGWRTDGLTVIEDTTSGMPAGLRRIRVKLDAGPVKSAFFRLVASD